MKNRDKSNEIVLVIRPHIRQYSYGGFMQITLAKYLLAIYGRHPEDTIVSGNCVHAKSLNSTCMHQHHACIGHCPLAVT